MAWTNAFYAIAGVLVGLFGAAIGYFVRIRRERQHTLKKCLFMLLRIWNDLRALNSLDLKNWVASFMAELRRRFPGEKIDDDMLTSQQLESIQSAMLALAAKEITEIEKTGLQEYNEMIVRLAEEEPILAYKLDKRPELRKLLTKAEQVFSELGKSVPELQGDKDADKFLRELGRKVIDGTHSGVLYNFEQDMIAVAAMTWNKRKVMSLIRYVYAQDLKLMNESIKVIVDQIQNAVEAAKTVQDVGSQT